jgi:hypothetical protein
VTQTMATHLEGIHDLATRFDPMNRERQVASPIKQ